MMRSLKERKRREHSEWKRMWCPTLSLHHWSVSVNQHCHTRQGQLKLSKNVGHICQRQCGLWLNKRDKSNSLTVTLLQKSDTSDLLFCGRITLSLFCSKETSDSLYKICTFHHAFDIFSILFPFVCPKANCSQRSSLH